MCRAVTCKECKKPTWAGCGAHVEAVLGSVPKDKRCACREARSAKPAAKPAATPGIEPVTKPGLAGSLRRLFGLD